MTGAVASEVVGDGEIRLVARLDGPPEAVWPLLTQPDNLPLWLGHPVVFDLEVGGRIEVEIDEGHRFSGEFVEIDPPNRLRFTWGWRTGPIEIPPGSTMVEMTLTARESGTELRLVHTGLGDWAERTIVGWTIKLDRLVLVTI